MHTTQSMTSVTSMTLRQRALVWSGAVVALLMLALFHSLVQSQVKRSALDKAARHAAAATSTATSMDAAKAAKGPSLVVVSIRE